VTKIDDDALLMLWDASAKDLINIVFEKVRLIPKKGSNFSQKKLSV